MEATNSNANVINEISTFVVGALQGTAIGSKFVDITKVKNIVAPLITQVFERLDKADEDKILAFIKNKALLQECIIPNVNKIISDGKLGMDDIPAFLNIIVGLYQDINQFVQSNKTISISSNDIIELGGLLIKIVIGVLLAENNMSAQLGMANALIDSAIKMVNLTVKSKTFSLKRCACCGGSN
jgi:hypothetical protein